MSVKDRAEALIEQDKLLLAGLSEEAQAAVTRQLKIASMAHVMREVTRVTSDEAESIERATGFVYEDAAQPRSKDAPPLEVAVAA